MRMEDTVQKLGVPIAIVVAGALIAAALFFSGGQKSAPQPVAQGQNQPSSTDQTVSGVQADDHVFGNPSAEVTIIEFSDTECPFCKRFHETMNKVMAEYGKDGKVAWVYRQLPLPQLHPKAPREAEATECAAELGGNDVFWKYTNSLYAVTPANNGLEDAQLFTLAAEAGLDAGAFKKCLESGSMKERVEKDVAEATTLGINGTPHSLILYKGKQIPIEGAQPFEVVKQLIEQMLAE